MALTLRSEDGKDFDVEEEIAKLCETLKNMLKYGG